MTVFKLPILSLGVAVFATSGFIYGAEVALAESPPPAMSGAGLTLSSALAEALSQGPALRVIEAEMDAARGEILTAQTRPNDEISFTPGLKRTREAGDSSYEFKGTIAYTRTFLFAGKKELLVSLAQRNVELRRLGIDGLRFQVSAAVREAFYELLAAQSIVSLRQQQIESAQMFQEAAAKRAESGYASDFEAVKSQGDVINAKKLLRAAEGQIAVARVELNTLLGRSPSAPLEVTGTIDTDAALPSLPALLALAEENNPSLRVQAMQAEIAGLNVRKARLARKPDYSVGPSLEYSKSEQVLGVSVSIPLAGKNYGQGEIQTASAEQRKALAEADQLRREIAGAVTQAFTRLATARDQRALYTPAYLDQLKSVVAQAEQSYAQSATSLLIYLDAKHTYFDMLADYYEAIADVATSRAALESAIGAPIPTNL